MKFLKFINEQPIITTTPISTKWEFPDPVVRMRYVHDFATLTPPYDIAKIFLEFHLKL